MHSLDFVSLLIVLGTIFIVLFFPSIDTARENSFEFYSEGNVVDNKVMFPDGKGGENCLSFPQLEAGEERTTLFLDESLMVVPPNNASWKIIFPVEDKFVVYNR